MHCSFWLLDQFYSYEWFIFICILWNLWLLRAVFFIQCMNNIVLKKSRFSGKIRFLWILWQNGQIEQIIRNLMRWICRIIAYCELQNYSEIAFMLPKLNALLHRFRKKNCGKNKTCYLWHRHNIGSRLYLYLIII